ncbi:unnamed protein product [Mytilus coruscus]|uniref:Uncharacterized protein n=1 Tax=Mytilus coruscus TaxID=42192 RepID=A0A6J8E7J2_MYTCO|nr:unnamed protein product [Mytilus coruscus]
MVFTIKICFAGICRKCIDVFKEVVPDITVYQTGLDSITDSHDSEKEEAAEEHSFNFTSDSSDNFYNLRQRTNVSYHNEFDDILECTSEGTQATNSQTSNWSDNIQTPLSVINQALSTIGRGSISPLKFQLSKPLNDVKESTLRYIKRKATESIDVLLDSIAPGQSSDLKKLIISEGIKNLNEPEKDSELTKLIVILFNDTNNNTVKYQLLSMIAEKYTKIELQNMIPGLTVYKIDQARQYASLHGPGSINVFGKSCPKRSNESISQNIAVSTEFSFFFNNKFNIALVWRHIQKHSVVCFKVRISLPASLSCWCK